MVSGERIKRICAFRRLTQHELGMKLGYEEHNADVRIAPYESGYRVPKNNTLTEMAKILNINYIHFIGVTPGCAEDIMLTFLGLDEDDHGTIHLFQSVRNPDKCNASDDKSVRYYNNDDWPAHAPFGMWLEYGLVNDFMREWCLRKAQLKNGEISEDECFEWKINQPVASSNVDYNGKDDKKCGYQ